MKFGLKKYENNLMKNSVTINNQQEFISSILPPKIKFNGFEIVG